MFFGMVNHWLDNCMRLFYPIDNIIIPILILHVAKIIVIFILLSLKLKRCMNLGHIVLVWHVHLPHTPCICMIK